MPASRFADATLDGRTRLSVVIHDNALTYGKEKTSDHVQHLTLAWHDIHEWQRDNEFIRSGYRQAQNTWHGCVHSVFGYLHNETVNILSHLGGATLFLFLLSTVGATEVGQYEATTWKDVLCQCKTFDYVGIIVLAVSSVYPPIYYAFFCSPYWQMIHLGAVTISGLGATYIVLNPEYGRPLHRGSRTAVFLALGMVALLPISHAFVLHGFTPVYRDMGFGYIINGAVLRACGALIYANRVSERWAPGWFDYVGSSPQSFHVPVVAAALCAYECGHTAFEYRHSPAAYIRGGVCT